MRPTTGFVRCRCGRLNLAGMPCVGPARCTCGAPLHYSTRCPTPELCR